MEDRYKLKYKGKWIKPKHVLGTYCYELYDNIDDVESMSKLKATSWRNLISEDQNLKKEDIELIKV